MSGTNLTEIIDNSKFSKFHGTFLAWCLAIIVVDGFDQAVFGIALPGMMEEWGLTPLQAGAIGGYGAVGMLIGSIVLGPLADKLGRKKTIIICVIFFSLFTLLCGLSPNATVFSVSRFIAGLGLGGVLPNVLSLATEYAPKKQKGSLPVLILAGISIGMMSAAGLSIFLIPQFGWRSLYILGGICLIFIPFLIKYLPESPRFLLVKKEKNKLYKILKELAPSIQPESVDSLVAIPTKKQAIDLKGPFKEGRAFSTFMFWIALFLSSVVTWGLNSWLPEFMIQAGFPLTSSLTFMMVYFAGGLGGTLMGAFLSDRISLKKTTVSLYLVGAATLMLLVLNPNVVLFYILIFIAGAGTVGTQMVAFAFVTNFYPEKIRSTGSGIALGLNKFGGIFGPTYGSLLVMFDLSLQGNFMAFAIPCFVVALSLSLIRTKGENTSYKQSSQAL